MPKKKVLTFREWLDQARLSENYMVRYKNRLRSFKNWPFLENCACTPEKMAKVGFYHYPTEQEPDLVLCYVCSMEWDGWNPEDEPWEEHKKSKDCEFVKVGKKWKDLTVNEHLKLEFQSHFNVVKEITEYDIEQVKRGDHETIDRYLKGN